MDGEADLIAGLVDDLDGDAGRLLDPLACVGAVREGEIDEGEASARGLQQRHGAVAVLHRGRADLDDKQPPVRVHHGVTLAPLHLLACVIPAWATRLGGLHALAIDHGRTWTGLAP